MKSEKEKPTFRNRFCAWAKALVLILCISAALSAVLPMDWWLVEVARSMQIQYFAFGLLFAGYFLWDSRAKSLWVLLALIPFGIGAAHILPWYLPLDHNVGRSIAGSPFKIMSFNVWVLNQRYDDVMTYIRKEAPDCVMVHEYSMIWHQKLVALDDTYPYSKKIPQTGNFGAAALCRFPIEDVETFYFGKARKPGILFRVKFQDEHIHVLTSHPDPPRTPRRFRGRNEQLGEMETVLSRLLKEKKRVVFLGDLNVTQFSPWLTELTRRSGLRNARKGNGIFPTWPAIMPLFFVPLDHILVGPGIQVDRFHVGPALGSDHFPVTAELSISKST